MEALGRSRGGWGTKIHLAFDGRGRPLAIRVTEGQRADSVELAALLDTIRVPQRRGRARKRPWQVVLDRGYTGRPCRTLLRRRGLRHVIPERRDEQSGRQRRGSRGGRPPRFDRAVYRERNWAERGVNRLKHWRRIATRYEKRAANYLAFLHFASVMIWLGR